MATTTTTTTTVISSASEFYKELAKLTTAIDAAESEEEAAETTTQQPMCLISNQPLTSDYVKLACGHMFNYAPLFHDIKYHKKIGNSKESNRLGANEIRCPYCRSKQSTLLPYYESYNFGKIGGVNWKYQPCVVPLCTFFGTPICYSNKVLKLVNCSFGTDQPYCSHHQLDLIASCTTRMKLEKKQQQQEQKNQLAEKKCCEKAAKEAAKAEKERQKAEKKDGKQMQAAKKKKQKTTTQDGPIAGEG